MKPLSLVEGIFTQVPGTLRLVWKSSARLTLALAVLTLLAALLPLGIAYAGKAIVDAVVAKSSEATLRWVLVELGLAVGLAITSRGLSLVRTVLGSRLGVDINRLILEKALTLELRHFEDSEFYDQLTRARREASSRPVALVGELFSLVQSLVTLAGYGLLLVRFSGWAVAALVLATVPATLAEMRFSKQIYRLRNWRSPESRKLLYLEYLLANDEHAKEVKLFGLGQLLLGRYRALAETFFQEDRALAVRRALVTQALALLGTVAFYGCYVLMATGAALGRISLGEMTLYVVAFRYGQQSFQAALSSLGSLYEHGLYMSNLEEFLALPTPEPVRPTIAQSAVAPEVPKGIRFEGLGFRYPGAPGQYPGAPGQYPGAPGGNHSFHSFSTLG
jgi:ATP-binding cassette subfamily B protein